MIIKIEDAPKIKRISLDISFEDDGQNTTTIINRPLNTDKGEKKDIILDFDTEFGSVSKEVVTPPSIDIEKRKPKVAPEMQDMEI